MIGKSIRGKLEREPFVPFRLVLSSGKHYDVTAPLSAALLKSEVFLVFADGERWALLPLLHIAWIQTLGNGRRRPGTGRKRR